MRSATKKQIRVLTLNDGDFNEKKLFSAMHGVYVHFVLGSSLFDKRVKIFSNYANFDDKFVRSKYKELEWFNTNASPKDNFNQYVELELAKCGTFHYYLIDAESERKCASGYLVVYPILRLANGQIISKNAIQCQTLLSKCLGSLDGWMDRILVTVNSGFNMIHFTPLQDLCKISNSSYAIRDHLNYNPLLEIANKTALKKFVDQLYNEHNLLSVSDLVYNHVALDCPLLKTCPNAAYNLKNSPYLRPAFVFDYVIREFSIDAGKGLLCDKGIPDRIEPHHLSTIRQYLLHHVFPKYRFHEFVMVNVEQVIEQFKQTLNGIKTLRPMDASHNDLSSIKLIQDNEYRRFGSRIDLQLCIDLLAIDWLLSDRLNVLNDEARSTITNDVVNGVDACLSNARYWFFEAGSYSKLSESTPLAPRYFLFPYDGVSVEEAEIISYDLQKCSQIMAYNGWMIAGGDGNSFAEEGSRAYLRRELVIWSDLVKTRFGKRPEDCPELWSYMEQYTRETAQVFHAVRLDNCHSTPIHVAEYMIDTARETRSNVYIFAELFTGDEALDNLFVNQIGITSLVRESMSASSPYDFGSKIHRYGGLPVGAFYQPPIRPMMERIANAMFYDLTHDNMSPIKVKSIYDLLPRMFLSNMVCCSTGSSRGYDELVPHNIDVVSENRLYRKWSSKAFLDQTFVSGDTGIIGARMLANQLHYHMAQEGYSQIYVDQVSDDTIAVTRHNPLSHVSIVLIARTSFSKPANPDCHGSHIRSVYVPGVVEKVLFEVRLEQVADIRFVPDKTLINGLLGYNLNLKADFAVNQSAFIHYDDQSNEHEQYRQSGGGGYVRFVDFRPGSVIAIKTILSEPVKCTTDRIRAIVAEFCTENSAFENVLKELTLVDMNNVLYRCESEELDDGFSIGAYVVPNFGKLVYCGLQGVMSVFETIRLKNDLGHSLCCNLREGDWLPKYLSNRLTVHTSTKKLGAWFDVAFKHLSALPRYLIPSYFDLIVTGSYAKFMEHSRSLMSSYIQEGSSVNQLFAMVSVQLIGRVKSAKMPQLCLDLTQPRPKIIADEYSNFLETQMIPSFSAGLTHFSTGIFRNWGRDTFIALRGLLLLTGRFDEARYLILSYGQCMRHGLIPNLLAEGISARYNCRDAFWWWLYSIKCYIEHKSDQSILADKVFLMYPTDHSDPRSPDNDPSSSLNSAVPLHQVIHNGLERHFKGIEFRERNAGTQIDENMSDEGFNVKIFVDKKTGFVHGGNEKNCGTWMDKMGGSYKAGNKGKPATPRDGCDVEIVGLSFACIHFFSQLSHTESYPHENVVDEEGTKLSLCEWSTLIKANFEKYFWIDDEEEAIGDDSINDRTLVNRKGIYKDVYGSKNGWHQYQLRPNFLIALVVAPEMVKPEHALKAARGAENILMGAIGVKTLDPSDWNYRGVYDNCNESDDMYVANGWNYHQGPEWIWLTGYLYRALLYFERLTNTKSFECEQKCRNIIGKHVETLLKSPWKGLPELTNENGAYCPFSCDTQAWSAASTLELLYDLTQK